MNRFSIFMLLIIFSGPSSSSEEMHEAAITELLVLSNGTLIVERTQNRFRNAFATLYQQKGLTEKDLEIINKYENKLESLLEERLGFEQLTRSTIAAYKEIFSLSEIETMIVFYKSSAGMKLINELPKYTESITRDIASATQEFSVELANLVSEMKAEANDAQ